MGHREHCRRRGPRRVSIVVAVAMCAAAAASEQSLQTLQIQRECTRTCWHASTQQAHALSCNGWPCSALAAHQSCSHALDRVTRVASDSTHEHYTRAFSLERSPCLTVCPFHLCNRHTCLSGHAPQSFVRLLICMHSLTALGKAALRTVTTLLGQNGLLLLRSFALTGCTALSEAALGTRS
jgi:hypothetical protein